MNACRRFPGFAGLKSHLPGYERIFFGNETHMSIIKLTLSKSIPIISNIVGKSGRG